MLIQFIYLFKSSTCRFSREVLEIENLLGPQVCHYPLASSLTTPSPSYYPHPPLSVSLTPSSHDFVRKYNCRTIIFSSPTFPYSVYLPKRILLDFPSITSLASKEKDLHWRNQGQIYTTYLNNHTSVLTKEIPGFTH